MKSLITDLLASARSVWRRPGTNALLVGVLALGIGSATAMFSVLRPVLLQALPYANPEQLVYVWETDLANGELTGGASFPDLADWRLRSQSVARFAAYARGNASISIADGAPRRILALNTTHDLASVLGVDPLIGRTLVEEDDVPGAAPVALLSETLWRDSFGADPSIVGRSLEIDGKSVRIVGVMPSGGPWAMRGDIWRPVVPNQINFLNQRGVHSLSVVARLAAGTTIEQADQEMRAIASALEAEYPEENVGRSARVVGMHAFLLRDLQRPMTLLAAAVGVLLLLTCCNTAILLLARTGAREVELGLRSSLGARRGRLIAQLGAESLILASLGAVVGIGLALATLQLVAALNPLPILAPDQWQLDRHAMAFTVLAALLAAVLAGTVPAWLYSRVDPARALGGSRGSASVGGESIRRFLVGAQVAIALTLLLGVGVLLRSYLNLAEVDPGLRAEGVASVSLALPASRYPMPPLSEYPSWPAVTQITENLLERARSIPGADAVGITQHAALAPAWTTSIEVEGRTVPEQTHEEIQLSAISPGALRTLGIPLLSGRDFEPVDRASSTPVVLINEATSRKYFPGTNPIGQRIRFWRTWREVVGVVGDVRSDGLTRPAEPAMHAPLAQTPFSSMTLNIRTSGDPALLLQPMREAIRDVEPGAVPYDEGSVAQRLADLMAPQRFAFGLTSLLALLAGALALSGQIGLIAVEVQRRRGEIGVRVALGARPLDVLRSVLGHSLRATTLGMLVGLVAYLLAAPVVEHFVYGIAARDGVAIVSVVMAFLASALLASAWPAWRALRMDPMQALRSD